VTIASSAPETRLRQRFIRRWPIGFVGIVATVALCLAAFSFVPPTFTATADVLLVPPPTSPTATATGNANPYITLGGMQPLADVVARAVTSSATLAQLRRQGLTGSYTVIRDANTDGPILTVTTKDKNAVATLADLSLVLATAQPQLDRLQSQQLVSRKDRVTATVVARDSAANASRKSQIRALVVAVVAGVVGTALVVSAADTLLIRLGNRRKIRRERSRTTGPATRSARVRITPTEAVVTASSTNARAAAATPSRQQRITTRSLARSRALARLRTDRSGAPGDDGGEARPSAAYAVDAVAIAPDNAGASVTSEVPGRPGELAGRPRQEPPESGTPPSIPAARNRSSTRPVAGSRSPVGSSNGHATADAQPQNGAGEPAPVPIATNAPRMRRRVAIRPMMRSRVADTAESRLNQDAEPRQGRNASRSGTSSR
jgi:hypothetical protein